MCGQRVTPGPGAGLAYTQVDARADHAVPLRGDGAALACGWTQPGRCAIPSQRDLASALVAAGVSHTVPLRTMARPWPWLYSARSTRHSGAGRGPSLITCRSRLLQHPGPFVPVVVQSFRAVAQSCRGPSVARSWPVAVIRQASAPSRSQAQAWRMRRSPPEQATVLPDTRRGLACYPFALLATPLRGGRAGSGDIGGTIGPQMG